MRLRNTLPRQGTQVPLLDILEPRRLLAGLDVAGMSSGLDEADVPLLPAFAEGDGTTANSDASGGASAEPGGSGATVPVYNTDFLTDVQLQNADSMTADEIRAFLRSYGSYFRNSVPDVDGVYFDLATVMAEAGRAYRINPQVLLATLQKEHVGVTRTTRPTESQMAFLMGSGSPTTARHQIHDAASRFRAYFTELTNNGQTRSGWKVGVAKRTQDNVWVTPATKATAGQFTYTPYAGAQWGGSDPRWGGVYLFYRWWNEFGFNDRTAPQVTHGAFEVNAPTQRLSLTFSENVENSLSISDLRLTHLGTGQRVSSSSLSLNYDSTTHRATITFPGFARGVLPDGNYRLTLPAGSVSDRADNPLANDVHVSFFVLAGDATRDRVVDMADFLVLRSNFGATSGMRFSDGDFTYDGAVDFADFLILRSRFGTSMAAPASGGSLFDGLGGEDDGAAGSGQPAGVLT